ncbi:MAG TPA: dihydropyrimidinase [Bacteroidales bacterium]|nr:dihydropyrimidinase [Bacteroidales bacterium]
MKMIIRNGTIVTDSQTFEADIRIENGSISEIGKSLQDRPDATNEIDAGGLYVFPGGIDPHVHLQLPTPAGVSSDDFYSGSRAALMGGVTSIIDFVTPARGQSILKALEIRKREAAKSLADYTFHVSPVEFTQNTGKELLQCFELGIRSFKVYMAYKSNIGLQDEELQSVLNVVGKKGGIVAVHCEAGDEIEKLRNKFFSRGQTSPYYHALSRPAETEAEAVKKVIEMADKAGCALYLVHISAARSLEHIAKAKQSGQPVYAETCPQYLLLDDTKYQGSFQETSPYVMSPPLRSKADNKALWQALSEGVIQSVGTDHCPFTMRQKMRGISDFRKIPNGAGGIEHRLALLFTYGVLENRITPNQFVSLCSTMPARIFGLYPRKGSIANGSDADLLIWNPETESTISASTQHQCCDVNIYEGIKTRGRPKLLIKGGEIVVQENRMLSEPEGQLLIRI